MCDDSWSIGSDLKGVSPNAKMRNGSRRLRHYQSLAALQSSSLVGKMLASMLRLVINGACDEVFSTLKGS